MRPTGNQSGVLSIVLPNARKSMELSVVTNEAPAALDPCPRVERAVSEPLLVLKFGSSVLRDISDLPAVAGEIYRQRRQGYRIIAVASALGGETDALLQEARWVAGGIDCLGVADLVSLGEERAVALLRIACERIGIRAGICRAEELGLRAEGPEADADYAGLQPRTLLQKLREHEVVIVPGFVGISSDGRRLLGRGGSDLTAAILGGELGADRVRLYKDVDGVFEQDPAITPNARKFEEISYAQTLEVARPLVHSKAIEFAAERRLRIEVETLGSCNPTRIGGYTQVSAATKRQKPLRIALAGYGVVGQALASRLRDDPNFEIVSILVRDVLRYRDVPPPVPLTSSVEQFLGQECDLLVELLSCERTAARTACEKLRLGVDVVTASKRLVSASHSELEENAQLGQTRFLISASVGGSVPILETIKRVRTQTEISQVSGILNGTVNFVLERMHAGVSFDVAIGEARERGFAEEDCEADLSGADAAAKLMIIAAAAYDVAPESVRVATQRLGFELEPQIRSSGERWVQLSSVRQGVDGIEARVTLCPRSDTSLPEANAEWNVGVIRCADGVELCVSGRGAGGPATAEAVLADLYELLHQTRTAGEQPAPLTFVAE